MVVAVSLLLRCCANQNLCRENINAAVTREKKSPQKHVAREKVIKTKLTAVKLLTQQELKKIGSVVQKLGTTNTLQHINKILG